MAKPPAFDNTSTPSALLAGDTKQARIFAAEKIIADISSGVYRSPAAALKELVSNAYDADATIVRINTDAPSFRELTITDNGHGMDINKFLDVISHIGGSRKRIDSDTSPHFKRKLIGRIGIGMLAVAQLGSRFFVSSCVKNSGRRFLAEVNLEPFHRDDAALKSMGKIKEDGEVQIGNIRYVDNIPERKDEQYTVIMVPNAKKGLISEMTSAVRKAVGATDQMDVHKLEIDSFSEIIDALRSARRADMVLDGYYYMLWELGLLCPVNYCEDGPFRVKDRNIAEAITFEPEQVSKFSVIVDEIELRRPQLFPNTRAIGYPSPDPKLYLISYDKRIAGRKLKFRGYIYSQQPSIEPEELKGIHIRIRHVGIGRYDRTWLGYPFDEGIKFGQVSGELYVEDGLEPALNIDRDSFRETDVHYQAMRAYIWQILRTQVFPEFKERQKSFRDRRRQSENTVQRARFIEATRSLPSPVQGEVDVAKHVVPTLSNWIQASDGRIIIQKAHWAQFIEQTMLDSQEAQKRFLRVVEAVVASELLTDVNAEEVESLLTAIAVAVQ